MKSRSSLSVGSPRCSRTAHPTRASTSAAGTRRTDPIRPGCPCRRGDERYKPMLKVCTAKRENHFQPSVKDTVESPLSGHVITEGPQHLQNWKFSEPAQYQQSPIPP